MTEKTVENEEFSNAEKAADILIDVPDSNWTNSDLILCGKFFTVVGKYEEKVKFLCLLCPSKPGVFLSADLSTSAHLKTHIKRRHPDRCSEFEEYRKNKPKRRQTFASQNVQSSSKERQTVLPFGWEIGVYPTLALMSRRSLGRHIFQKVDEVHAKIKTDLSQQAFLCTTADVWSTKHRSFMGVTVHWINESTIERQSATLACSRFKGAHTYTKVAEILSSIHRKFVISRSTIIATVTDNGANFAKFSKNSALLFRLSIMWV
ncbi:hypothetical protein Avbf_02246 [Armadillidium vulgare]|nr:hypothetical protein Avbf_02246 [Armadillidium vulgare]